MTISEFDLERRLTPLDLRMEKTAIGGVSMWGGLGKSLLGLGKKVPGAFNQVVGGVSAGLRRGLPTIPGGPLAQGAGHLAGSALRGIGKGLGVARDAAGAIGSGAQRLMAGIGNKVVAPAAAAGGRLLGAAQRATAGGAAAIGNNVVAPAASAVGGAAKRVAAKFKAAPKASPTVRPGSVPNTVPPASLAHTANTPVGGAGQHNLPGAPNPAAANPKQALPGNANAPGAVAPTPKGAPAAQGQQAAAATPWYTAAQNWMKQNPLAATGIGVGGGLLMGNMMGNSGGLNVIASAQLTAADEEAVKQACDKGGRRIAHHFLYELQKIAAYRALQQQENLSPEEVAEYQRGVGHISKLAYVCALHGASQPIEQEKVAGWFTNLRAGSAAVVDALRPQTFASRFARNRAVLARQAAIKQQAKQTMKNQLAQAAGKPAPFPGVLPQQGGPRGGWPQHNPYATTTPKPNPAPQGLGGLIQQHPVGALAGGAGIAYLLGKQNNNNGGFGDVRVLKTGSEKTALGGPWARRAALLGIGGGLGAAGGYAYGRHRFAPQSLSMTHPETGEYMGDLTGPGYAVRDLEDELSAAQQDGSYEALDQVMNEAQARGVAFKGASERRGRRVARSFLQELSKLASTCVPDLQAAEVIDEKTASDFTVGVYDMYKLASFFRLHGSLVPAPAEASAS